MGFAHKSILKGKLTMKKICIICLILSMLVPMACASEIKTDHFGIVKIIDSADLTTEDLMHRNGNIIIERVIGIVEDAENGHGRILNGDPNYYYINYSSVKGISKGDVICTYLLYNPENNYEDDIIMRFDYVAEFNFNSMR